MEAYWEREAARSAVAIEKQRRAARAAWIELLQNMRMRAQLKKNYEDEGTGAGGGGCRRRAIQWRHDVDLLVSSSSNVHRMYGESLVVRACVRARAC